MTRLLRDALDEANPNKIATELQVAKVGSGLALTPRFIDAAVDPANDSIILDERAKAAQVIRAYASAPAGVDYLTPVLPEGAVAAGQVVVTPTGDILFAAADNVTQAEVLYVAVEGEVFEDVVVVDAGGTDAGLFAQGRHGVVLLEAEILAPVGVAGAAAVQARGTAAPAAGQAALLTDGTGVQFAAADAVTSARLRYIATPGVGNGPAPAFGTRLDTEGTL